MTANYTLRDQIKEYWSLRAETFDLEPGHEIFSMREKDVWHQLIQTHLGGGAGRVALDLACGTGVISHLLYDCKFDVTGIDWSDAMLAQAREKSKRRQSNIQFRIGDAENTREPIESYDVIMTRHLVWTLVDPLAALNHWHAILKPGGKVLIIDGDFVRLTWIDKIGRFLETIGNRINPMAVDGALSELTEIHKTILKQIYFKNGARSEDVVSLLDQAGFQNITVQTDLSEIHKAQGKNLPLMRSLKRRTQHRYAISASKPAL